jgi:hypothetical protein
MSDEKEPQAQDIGFTAAEAELIKMAAEVDTQLVNVLTGNTLPYQMIVQMLVTHAATICVYHGITRPQFMELGRAIFGQIQAINKQGLLKDEPKIKVESH